MRVKWDDVASGLYEEMISVLIKRLFPTAQRIDGRGGDGGRDVQVLLADGIHLFELKSFTGRLDEKSGKRRTQVEKSLATAAKLKPNDWTLVVPIDHTPGELMWFETLRAKYNFPLYWYGKSWLDSKMADDLAVSRYFVASASDEVVKLLIELGNEQAAAAAVGSVSDAINRIHVITNRLADIDPFYRYEIRTGPEGTFVTTHEAYPGASKDRPIRVCLKGRFPDTPEGSAKLDEFMSAVSFGTPATLEPEYVVSVSIDSPIPTGIPNTGVKAVLGGTEDPWTERALFKVVAPDGRSVATLPVRLGNRTSGTHGGIVTATDSSGALTVRIRIDIVNREGSANFKYAPPEDALPVSVLPALHLIELLLPTNALVLDFDDRSPKSTFPLDQMHEPLVPAGYVRMVEALARIQTATRTAFPIPTTFSQEDGEAIYRSDCLLRGQKVAITWMPYTFKGTVTQALIDAFEEPPRVMAIAQEAHIETICGVEVNLGPARLVMLSAAVRPRDKSMVVNLGDEIELAASPGENDQGEWELLPSDADLNP